MTLAANLRKSLDTIRGIPGALGLRPYSVSLVVTTTSGGNPFTGEATQSTTETELTHSDGSPIKVVQVSQEDVTASGGLYALQDLRVGPFTPEHDAGGFAPGALDPEHEGKHITWRVIGPGVDGFYKRRANEFDSALSYYVILRKMGTE